MQEIVNPGRTRADGGTKSVALTSYFLSYLRENNTITQFSNRKHWPSCNLNDHLAQMMELIARVADAMQQNELFSTVIQADGLGSYTAMNTAQVVMKSMCWNHCCVLTNTSTDEGEKKKGIRDWKKLVSVRCHINSEIIRQCHISFGITMHWIPF